MHVDTAGIEIDGFGNTSRIDRRQAARPVTDAAGRDARLVQRHLQLVASAALRAGVVGDQRLKGYRLGCEQGRSQNEGVGQDVSWPWNRGGRYWQHGLGDD